MFDVRCAPHLVNFLKLGTMYQQRLVRTRRPSPIPGQGNRVRSYSGVTGYLFWWGRFCPVPEICKSQDIDIVQLLRTAQPPALDLGKCHRGALRPGVLSERGWAWVWLVEGLSSSILVMQDRPAEEGADI